MKEDKKCEPSTEETNKEVEKIDEVAEDKQYDMSNFSGIIEMFHDKLDADEIKTNVITYLKKLIVEYKMENYHIIFLYDEHRSINTHHSDKIYNDIKDLKNCHNILLILQSHGGKIEPAYLISKACKRLSKEKFVISIPRKAKSAATLISLGADELHMGFLSELGPIDPQISGFPASGLSNAMEKIAEMTEKYPDSSNIFSNYLIDKVSIRDLGYFERINESAAQYAERLLKDKDLPDDWDEKKLSDHLTNHYKDHGFVIDSDEASSLLGDSIVCQNTDEYKFSNKIYDCLDNLNLIYSYLRKKQIAYVGGIDDGLDIMELPEN